MPARGARLLAQRRETDPAKRRDLLRQAIRYLNGNALAFPTFRRAYFMFWQPYIRAYYPHADGGNLPFQALRLHLAGQVGGIEETKEVRK